MPDLSEILARKLEAQRGPVSGEVATETPPAPQGVQSPGSFGNHPTLSTQLPQTQEAPPVKTPRVPVPGELSQVPPGGVPPVLAGLGSSASQATLGLITGITENPLLRPFFELGVPAEQLDQLAKTAGATGPGALFQFIGRWAPDIAGALTSFNLGRAAALKIASFGDDAGIAALKGIAARQKDTLANAALTKGLAASATEQGVRIAGGSLGVGAYEGVKSFSVNGSLTDAGKDAAIATALTATGEGIVVGLGKAFSAGRSIIQAKAASGLEKAQAAFRETRASLNTELNTLTAKMETITDKASQQLLLEEAAVTVARPADAIARLRNANALRVAEGKLARTQRLISEGTTGTAKTPGKKALGTKLSQLQREVTAKQATISRVEELLSDLGGDRLVRDVPLNPAGLGLTLREAGLKVLITPESLAGKLGAFAAKAIFRPIQQADIQTSLAAIHTAKRTEDSFRRATAALGLSRKQASKDSEAFLDVWHAMESGEEAGVRQYMASVGRPEHADDIVQVLREMEEDMATVYNPLVKMGAEEAITPQSLAEEFGVKWFFPHEPLQVAESKIMGNMAKIFGEKRAAELFKANVSKVGLAKSSSIDFNRVQPGSLRDLANTEGMKGIYETNPFVNYERYMNRATKRLSYGEKFGFNGELQEEIIAAVSAESGQGAATLANNILDTVLGNQYFNQHWVQLSRIAVNTQIFSKLGLAVIPNMGQGANALIFSNFRNLMKGFGDAIRPSSKRDIEIAVAVSDTVHNVMNTVGATIVKGRSSGAGRLDAVADGLEMMANFTLRRSGFSAFEQWNKTMSGGVGRYGFREDLAKAVAGNLRGGNLDAAIRRMDSLGLNRLQFKRLIEEVKASGDDFLASPAYKEIEDRAMYRFTQLTQFTPGVLRRPTTWATPAGRVIFQFKSFALNHGRFMKDQVFAEAGQGNLGPLAHLLAVYPIVGEAVGNLKALARDKDRESNGVYRLIDNASMNGGLGLASDVVSSGQIRGGLLQTLVGPTVSDMARFGSLFLQADGPGAAAEFRRQPTYIAATQAAKAAIVTTVILGSLADQAGDALGRSFSQTPGGPTGTKTFGDLIQEKRAQRQQ